MKKISIYTVLLLLGFSVFAKDTLRIGAHAGYFSSRDQNLKNIYKNDNVVYGLNIGARLWQTFYVIISGTHFTKTSGTSLLGDPTTLAITPVTLSLRYSIPVGKIRPYLGIGYTYIYYRERSDIGNISGEGQGYSLTTGIEFNFSSHFGLELGLNYNDTKVRPTRDEVQLGGVQVGISIVFVI